MVYGLAYYDGSAHGVYFAGWSDGHRDQGLRMAISIGDYEEEAEPTDRVAVGLCAHLKGQHVTFDVVGPEDSPWGDYAFIGPMLPQQDALDHPYLYAFIAIAKEVVRLDDRVRTFLKETTPLH